MLSCLFYEQKNLKFSVLTFMSFVGRIYNCYKFHKLNNQKLEFKKQLQKCIYPKYLYRGYQLLLLVKSFVLK